MVPYRIVSETCSPPDIPPIGTMRAMKGAHIEIREGTSVSCRINYGLYDIMSDWNRVSTRHGTMLFIPSFVPDVESVI